MAYSAFEVLAEVGKYCRPWWRKLILGFRSHLYDMVYYPTGPLALNSFLKHWRDKWLPQLVYTSESFDCDDFAFLFKALCVKDLGVNCAFLVGGEVRKDGRLLGLHAWNMVLLMGEQKLAFVEPQLGEILQVKDGKIVSSDGWEYIPLWVVG
ncbi:MAG: hypothetical protein ACXQTI_02700 [Candidatus Nezhaarchaeales archaeon]